MTEKDVGSTYTQQATRMIAAMPDDELPTVVAGDFNASKSPEHLRNVERLRERALVSAYHRVHDTEHSGIEEHPTSYFRWQRERPYHMDFVFLPEEWSADSVEVGTFEKVHGIRIERPRPSGRVDSALKPPVDALSGCSDERLIRPAERLTSEEPLMGRLIGRMRRHDDLTPLPVDEWQDLALRLLAPEDEHRIRFRSDPDHPIGEGLPHLPLRYFISFAIRQRGVEE
jgi:hypothetical protein